MLVIPQLKSQVYISIIRIVERKAEVGENVQERLFFSLYRKMKSISVSRALSLGRQEWHCRITFSTVVIKSIQYQYSAPRKIVSHYVFSLTLDADRFDLENMTFKSDNKNDHWKLCFSFWMKRSPQHSILTPKGESLDRPATCAVGEISAEIAREKDPLHETEIRWPNFWMKNSINKISFLLGGQILLTFTRQFVADIRTFTESVDVFM